MPVCRNVDWTMRVISAGGAEIALPFLRNVMITNGRISGRVELPDGTRISDLAGECNPVPGLPEVAAVTFRFRLKDAESEIGMLMSGVGFFRLDPNKANWEGTWVAHPPTAETPAADQLVTFVLPGSGDTGTGTATQT